MAVGLQRPPRAEDRGLGVTHNDDRARDTENAGYYRVREDGEESEHAERFDGLVYVHKATDGTVVAIELIAQ